ncbi:MAG: POTRA domain-containing protein [Candidatus Acidiferrales bacterium]
MFSDEQLRKLLPLREGDIFSVEKIREALDAMKKLYGNYGYIDFVVSPTTNIADDHPRISLVMEMDQQKQFRVGTVEVFGPDPKTESRLKSALKPGEIYSPELLRRVLEENRAALPSDFSLQDVEFHRDVKSGTVDLRFNLQTCPQVQD